MTYEEAANIISTARDEKKGKRINNNTYLQSSEDKTFVILLHETEILTFLPNGLVKLDSGGWKTVTTKSRMNNYLENAYIFSSEKKWYITDGYGETHEFFDGIEIMPNKPKPSYINIGTEIL